MSYFWTHYDNIPEGLGFGQFSVAHLVWVAAMVLLIVATAVLYKKGGDALRLNIRKAIAFTLIGSDILKLCVMALTPVDATKYLPLEICSFASYAIILDSLWPNNKLVPQMLVLLFLPATLMALVFPTVTALPPINFFVIHQFIFHALIAAYVIARFANNEIKITYPGLWSSVLKICCVAAPVFAIDTYFHKNFMFLTDSEGNPALDFVQNITGPGLPYLAGLVVFVIIVLHVFFCIFKGIEKVFLKH